MQVFFRRFIGALALDAGAFEDIEAARDAGMQSVLVVLAVGLAGGIGAIGAGAVGVSGFVTSPVMVLGYAAAVVAVRQALDYRHTARAVTVCGIAWLVSFGTMTAVALIFSRRVG